MSKSDGLPVLPQDCLSLVSFFEESASGGTGEKTIARFLAQARESHRASLFTHLLYAQLKRRQQAGETPSAIEYREHFPEYIAQIDHVFSLPTASTTIDYRTLAQKAATHSKSDARPNVPGYELISELGKGGMGIVYKATQVALRRIVALKMVRYRFDHGPQELARFQTEGETVARLQHPNIVQVFEVGVAEGAPFLSMEFVEGGSLARRLKDQPFSPESAARLVETLARAMHLAHSRNVVHRDLKPANVLLTADGIPKIADFGLAKQLDADSGQTQSGAVMGTPSYMAVEQASGQTHAAGPAADVYALGAILYECLTGKPPFKGANVAETLEHVRTQEPRRPSRDNPMIPRDLETICLKCLRKEPEHRYSSSEALAEDLRRFRADEPIDARPAKTPERLWRWCRRKPALAATSAAAILGVFVAAVIFAGAFFVVSDSLNKQTIERTKAETIGEEYKRLAKKESDARTEAETRREEAQERAVQVGFNSFFVRSQENPAIAFVGTAQMLSKAAELKHPALLGSMRLHLGSWSPEMHHLRWIGVHSEIVTTVVFSADGKTALTAGGDKAARMWDTGTGKLIGTPFQQESKLFALALSADGKIALTNGSMDSVGYITAAQLWDTVTGKPMGSPLKHQDRISVFDLSPDGKIAITGGHDKTARLWDTATGNPIGPPLKHQGIISHVDFSADGKIAITGSFDKTARLWETATGNPIGPPLQHQAGVRAVALSADGKTAITGSTDKSARLWEAATGKAIGSPLRHGDEVVAVALSHFGDIAVTGSVDTTARVWETATGNPVGSPLQHQGVVKFVALSTDEKTVLTGSYDKTARLWDAATGRPIGPPLQHQGMVTAVSLSDDGKLVLTGSEDKTVRLWERSTDQLVARSLQRQSRVRSMALSTDGKVILTGDYKTAQVWQVDTGQPIGQPLPHQDLVTAVALSADGRFALTAEKQTTRFWEVATGEPIGQPVQHEGRVHRVALSADGRVAMTTVGKTVRLWDSHTFRPISVPLQHLGSYVVMDAALSGDGKTVITTDATARVWDVGTGNAIGRPLELQESVNAVALSGDGKIGLAATFGNTARLWDTSNGKTIGPALHHSDRITAVALSADGKFALTGCYDRTAQLWEVATGKPIGLPLRHNDIVGPIALSADGKVAVTVSKQTAWLWKTAVPMSSEPQRVALWAQVITGLECDEAGTAWVLQPDEWQKRRNRLLESGGPPAEFIRHDKVEQSPQPQPNVEIHAKGAEDLQAWGDKLNETGYLPVTVNVQAGGQPLFNGIAIKNTKQIPFRVTLAKVGPASDKTWKEMAGQGYRPNSSHYYLEAGKLAEVTIWHRDGQAYLIWGGNLDFINQKVTDGRKMNWRPVGLTSTRISEKEQRFGCTLQPDNGVQWEIDYSLSIQELVNRFKRDRSRGWRPDVLSCYWDGQMARFMTVVVENKQDMEWVFEKDLSSNAYEQALAARKKRGWRPSAVLSYLVDSQVQYAVVWLRDIVK